MRTANLLLTDFASTTFLEVGRAVVNAITDGPQGTQIKNATRELRVALVSVADGLVCLRSTCTQILFLASSR